MRLMTNPASPFGRKVVVVAHELGLIPPLEIVHEALTPVSPSAAVTVANPLGKIPCLVRDAGAALYDSRVIAEYLDSLHAGPRLFPAGGEARWQALTLQALGDGIMDAAVGIRYELALRPEALHWQAWMAAQETKIAQALDRLEALAPGFGEPVDIGSIAVGCALGYLDFRFLDFRWRDARPQLAAWFAEFDARPAMQATRPSQL